MKKYVGIITIIPIAMLNNREDITRYKLEREEPYLLINCWGLTGRIVLHIITTVDYSMVMLWILESDVDIYHHTSTSIAIVINGGISVPSMESILNQQQTIHNEICGGHSM